MVKIPMYDNKGRQSKKFSIIVGVDENGKKFISAPPDIILDYATDKDGLVSIKRNGKEYFMPITYKQYEEYHNEMFGKKAEQGVNIISKKIKENLDNKPEEKLKKELEELKKRLGEKELENLGLIEEAKKKDTTIVELNEQLREKDEALIAKDKIRQKEIETLNKQNQAEKNGLYKQLGEKDKTIVDLDKQLETQKQEHKKQLKEKDEKTAAMLEMIGQEFDIRTKGNTQLQEAAKQAGAVFVNNQQQKSSTNNQNSNTAQDKKAQTISQLLRVSFIK